MYKLLWIATLILSVLLASYCYIASEGKPYFSVILATLSGMLLMLSVVAIMESKHD